MLKLDRPQIIEDCKIMTVKEVAKKHGCSGPTVYNLCGETRDYMTKAEAEEKTRISRQGPSKAEVAEFLEAKGEKSLMTPSKHVRSVR